MVVLSFQVTDNKGHYVNGLKPKDFRILEDGIPQKLATFAEGNKPPVQVAEDGTHEAASAVVRRRARPRDALGCVRRHQRVRAVRHQQLYVSRLRLRLRCHRRFHPRPGPRRFGRRVHLQPQSEARRAADPGAQRRDLRPAQSRGGRRFGALQLPAADACATPPKCPGAKW